MSCGTVKGTKTVGIKYYEAEKVVLDAINLIGAS